MDSTWIEAGATLSAAAIGVGAILFQLAKQGRLNRESVAENEQRRLKSRMYEEVETACNAFIEANARYLSRLISDTQQIQIASYSKRDERPFSVPTARIMDLARLKSEYQTASIGMVMLIERRQFIAPSILIFRTALAAANHDAEQKFTNLFFGPGMPAFPSDRPDGQGVFPYTPPLPEEADALAEIAFLIVGDLQTAVSYVEDFSVEMQNLLVADLFGAKVKHRVPIDPACRVVRLEDAKSLERYFLEETDWGRMIQHEEAKALARFAHPAG